VEGEESRGNWLIWIHLEKEPLNGSSGSRHILTSDTPPVKGLTTALCKVIREDHWRNAGNIGTSVLFFTANSRGANRAHCSYIFTKIIFVNMTSKN